MTSRGHAFTVIELLIVVALLLVLTSLTIVSGFAWSDAERVKASERGISASVEEARAMALREGRPVRLVALTSPSGSTRLALELWDEQSSDEGPSMREAASGEDPTSDRPDVIYELPEGLSIVSADETGSFVPHETDILTLSESVPILLLDVFPDGQAKLAHDSWQLEAHEKVFLPTLDAWAGRLQFEAVEQDEFAPYGSESLDAEPAL